LNGEVNRNLAIFGEEGEATEDEAIEEFGFSFGIIKETEDSLFFKNVNGISLCLRLVAELEIRGGGIVGIGDLVDRVLK